jgi:predicted RNase H-like HicB family nuclease
LGTQVAETPFRRRASGETEFRGPAFPNRSLGTSKRKTEEEAEAAEMINLPYSLTIEATEDPEFFGFFSEELEGFSGVGHSVEDCLYRARFGMKEHVQLLKEQRLPIPKTNDNPTVTIVNERKLSVA